MTTSERKCSSCDKPADFVIDDADPSKGNLACADCVRLWPLSTATPIQDIDIP